MLPSLKTLFGVNVRDAPLLCIGEGTNELQKIIYRAPAHQAASGLKFTQPAGARLSGPPSGPRSRLPIRQSRPTRLKWAAEAPRPHPSVWTTLMTRAQTVR